MDPFAKDTSDRAVVICRTRPQNVVVETAEIMQRRQVRLQSGNLSRMSKRDSNGRAPLFKRIIGREHSRFTSSCRYERVKKRSPSLPREQREKCAWASNSCIAGLSHLWCTCWPLSNRLRRNNQYYCHRDYAYPYEVGNQEHFWFCRIKFQQRHLMTCAGGKLWCSRASLGFSRLR